MAEEKKFTGVSLIINLNNKDDDEKAEPIQTLAFFAPKAEAKVLYSADRISDEERAPAKYVAFPTPGGFDIVESDAYVKQKGAEKAAKIGVVLGHSYTNAQDKPGVLFSGGFNPGGMAKDAKIGEQPFRALGSFTGVGAAPIAEAKAGVMAAAKAKREAAKNAGGEAPAEEQKSASSAPKAF